MEKELDVIVVGDSCLDVFVYCSVERLAPDFPVPILNQLYQTENPGMAKIVYENLKDFSNCQLFTNNEWDKHKKIRLVHSETNHMFLRLDEGRITNKFSLEGKHFNSKLVVVSDYNKGYITESDIEAICEAHPRVFLDTKKILGPWAKKAFLIKINNKEYMKSKEAIDDELEVKIIRTHGENGCFFKNKNFAVDRVEVKDTSGAGDSFMAGLVLGFLKTNNVEKSIWLANKCASEVVKHRGVTKIEPEKHLKALSQK